MTAKEEFNISEKDLARYTRSVGHPARIALLVALAKRGNIISGEIIEVPQLSQTTVLQHLRELKRAGLVKGRIFGSKAEYSLDLETFKKFQDLFNEFSRQVRMTDAIS